MFGTDNAAMKGVAIAANKIREHRKVARENNPFLAFQETVSKNIVDFLDKWRDTQEALSEAIFLGIYGSPALQAAVGIEPDLEVSPEPEMCWAPQTSGGAYRRVEVADRLRGFQGMRHSRPALYRDVAGNG